MPLARRTPADRSDPTALRRLAQLAPAVAAPVAAPTAAPVEPSEPAEDAWWADHTRIAALPPVPPLAPAAPVAPELPLPGRHAARGGSWRPPLPSLPALPVLGVAHLAVVALTIALGLALTTWWIVRDQGHPLDPAAPLTPVAAAADTASEPLVPLTSPSASPGSATTGTGTVTIDVTGKVRRPGIVVLDQGARVTDALAAAGGPRKGVDLSPLNLARVLVDGEQVVVGTPAAPAPAAPAPGAPGAAAGVTGGAAGPGPAPLVNLNTAGQTELEALPQVGPVTAQSILTWRTEHGGFTRVGELLEVDGIGPKTLEQLLPHVTV
ncbi:helix-hairpin-helix domain-containing protein [Pimelobacter simplex]|uniref:helix-hairpin-helix domain-containing protein n=1 Tax=Nocardioides simplex TaxID=2045 RepID=UPI003AAE6C8C